jgi:hypothetical protein
VNSAKVNMIAIVKLSECDDAPELFDHQMSAVVTVCTEFSINLHCVGRLTAGPAYHTALHMCQLEVMRISVRVIAAI